MFEQIFGFNGSAPMTAVEFTDTRTDLIGAPVEFDDEAFHHAMLGTGLPSVVPKVAVEVSLPTPAQVEAQTPGSILPKEDGVHLILPISDRFTYSAGSVDRVNRNLIHLLRFISVTVEFSRFLPPPVAMAVVARSQSILAAEAYEFAKAYCSEHDDLPIVLPLGE